MAPSQKTEPDNVSVKVVWDRLRADPEAVLIDVRTRAEWTYVGVPDLSETGKRVLLVEWQTYPDNRVNSGFVDELSQQLAGLGAGKSSPLYFICRSGARSLQAALAMNAAGWESCHNVADGFEGPLDPSRHRGARAGWKAAGLPWAQG